MSKSKYWKRSNDMEISNLTAEDELSVEEVDIKETELPDTNDSGYIVVRRITYGRNPTIKVPVGADVPTEIINNSAVFDNLLSKGAIVKRSD